MNYEEEEIKEIEMAINIILQYNLLCIEYGNYLVINNKGLKIYSKK